MIKEKRRREDVLVQRDETEKVKRGVKRCAGELFRA